MIRWKSMNHVSRSGIQVLAAGRAVDRVSCTSDQSSPVRWRTSPICVRPTAAAAVSTAPLFISISIRSAISCAGPRSWPMVQSAA